jgi:hypothetical protein
VFLVEPTPRAHAHALHSFFCGAQNLKLEHCGLSGYNAAAILTALGTNKKLQNTKVPWIVLEFKQRVVFTSHILVTSPHYAAQHCGQ